MNFHRATGVQTSWNIYRLLIVFCLNRPTSICQIFHFSRKPSSCNKWFFPSGEYSGPSSRPLAVVKRVFLATVNRYGVHIIFAHRARHNKPVVFPSGDQTVPVRRCIWCNGSWCSAFNGLLHKFASRHNRLLLRAHPD